jgi:hypothetical protein
MNHYPAYAFNLSFLYFFVTSLLLANFLFVQICRDFMIFAENSWIRIQHWMLAPPDVGPNIQIVWFHFKFIFHVNFRYMSSWSILFFGSVSSFILFSTKKCCIILLSCLPAFTVRFTELAGCNIWQHVISCVIVPERPAHNSAPELPSCFYCEIYRINRADL